MHLLVYGKNIISCDEQPSSSERKYDYTAKFFSTDRFFLPPLVYERSKVCSYPELLSKLQFLTGTSRMEDLIATWHCIQVRAEATEWYGPLKPHLVNQVVRLFFKSFLLADIKFLQKFIEIMFFLFELCRNHLQAIKPYHLPERNKEVHFHTTHGIATFMNQRALVWKLQHSAFSWSMMRFP